MPVVRQIICTARNWNYFQGHAFQYLRYSEIPCFIIKTTFYYCPVLRRFSFIEFQIGYLHGYHKLISYQSDSLR